MYKVGMNPFAYQIFAFIVAFSLVFRSNLAYSRYWEGRTLLQVMMGRLSFFAVESLSEDIWLDADHSICSPEEVATTFEFYRNLIHHVSLLFVMMVKTLRKDFDLDSVYVHQPYNAPPPLDASQGKRGWTEVKGFLMKMLALDGGGNKDCAMVPDLPVVGGLSQEEARILQSPIDSDDMLSSSVNLQGSRPLVVYAWIIKLLMGRSGSGNLRGGAVTARHMNTLQEAMAAFGQAAKTCNTPFPFAWAQLVYVCQYTLTISLPFLVVAVMNHSWTGVILTFVVVVTYAVVNELATELEDPFGLDPNDLPMERFVYDFNQNLLAACWQIKPKYFNDINQGRPWVLPLDAKLLQGMQRRDSSGSSNCEIRLLVP